MSDNYFYEPRQGHGLPHDPFKAIVAPLRPGHRPLRDAAARPGADRDRPAVL